MASESFLPNTHQRGLLVRAVRTRASSHREPKPITGAETRVETAATTTNARALLRRAGTRFNRSRIGRSVWYDKSRTVVFVSRDTLRFMTQKRGGV